ncbi:MAG: hypothetical protein K2J00_07845 [Bacteroidaceae bacterium]|nr:hypothetical protein [Bacteroidaceae bacterium]
MDIQDRIAKTIAVIQEAGQGLTRELLQNILLGNVTEEIQKQEFDSLESFGIAEDMDEMDWNAIFDRAIEEGLLKIKNQKNSTLTYTPEGKKFRKKPYSVTLRDGSGEEEHDGMADADINVVVSGTVDDRHEEALSHVTSERSKRQIKLIRAIDRKIALDDFAESENTDLDEVLDDLEAMLLHGKRMDISYFTNEVIGREDIEEVRESMPSGKLDMDILRREWGDVYNEEELRLLRYILS